MVLMCGRARVGTGDMVDVEFGSFGWDFSFVDDFFFLLYPEDRFLFRSAVGFFAREEKEGDQSFFTPSFHCSDL